MISLFADHDAWGLYHACPPLSHTQLGLVVETFIVCYLGLLLVIVVGACVKSLWRSVADPEPHEKPRIDQDGRDPKFFDQRGPRIVMSDSSFRMPNHR